MSRNGFQPACGNYLLAVNSLNSEESVKPESFFQPQQMANDDLARAEYAMPPSERAMTCHV